MKRIYYSIVFRFHIIGVQVTIGRLGKSRQQQLAESGLLEKKIVHNRSCAC